MTEERDTALNDRIWPVDEDGHLCNRALAGPLPESLLELCHDVTDLALLRFGERLHSVYLSGDATWEWPAHAVFRIVLRDSEASDADLSLMAQDARPLRMFSGLETPMDIRVHGWSELQKASSDPTRLEVRLAVNSRCLAGPDLSGELSPTRPDDSLGRCLMRGYAELIATARRDAPRLANETRLKALSRTVARRTLETAFALVIDIEEVYTECPDLMAGFAALHWPERRTALAMAERIARDGISLSLELQSFLDHHTLWVVEEVQKRLNQTGGTRSNA